MEKGLSDTRDCCQEQVKASSTDPATGLGSKFCSSCLVIAVSTWGKRPASAPETRGLWEKHRVVLICVWGGR